MGTAIANTTGNPVMATVQSAGSYEAGGPAIILIDGADTTCTANGLAGYTPSTGDRLLVQRVQSVMTIISLVSVAFYAPTLTGSLIQTAASGLRVWMSGQEESIALAEQAGISFGSGLAAEVAPAKVSLIWDGDTTSLATALTTGAPITSLNCQSVGEAFTIPKGAIVELIALGTTHTQQWTTTSTVTASTTGNWTIPVESQTPNYAYPSAGFLTTVVKYAGGVPDNSTFNVGIAILAPSFAPMVGDASNGYFTLETYLPDNTVSGKLRCDSFTIYDGNDNIIVTTATGSGVQLGSSNGTYGINVTNTGVQVGGNGWKNLSGIDSGEITSIPVVGANGGTQTFSVTFTQPFQNAPAVVCGSNGDRLTCNPSSITTTGFTFTANNWTTTDSSAGHNGWWIAIG